MSNLFDASVTSCTNLSQMTYNQCHKFLEMMIVDWIACLSFIWLFMWYFELVCVAADCVHQTVSYSKESCLQPEDDLSSKPSIVEHHKIEADDLVQQLNTAENARQTVVEIFFELAGYAYKTAYNTATYGMDFFVMQPINWGLSIIGADNIVPLGK